MDPSGDVVPRSPRGPRAGTEPSAALVEPSVDVECPICYQEYNHSNKCPRMLACLHVFCSECLKRIHLTPWEPSDPGEGPRAICCPLCRHLTPLETGDALALPCNSRVLARLPHVGRRTPAGTATRLATVTQRVVLCMEGAVSDGRFLILPTVSLRVEQMHPERPCGAAPGLLGEEGVMQQSRRTLLCVQLLAVIFWVLFMIICVVGVVFGPYLFKKNL